MIEIILYCVSSSIASVGIFAGIQKLSTKKKIQDDHTDLYELGFTVEDDPRKFETEEQYLTRLKSIHKTAWKEYSWRANKEVPLLKIPDSIVQRTLLQYKKGELTYEIDNFYILFSNGLNLWIENKYYSFGNICSSNVPRMSTHSFNSFEGRLSEYTFMFLVDIIFEIEKPAIWRQLHEDYNSKL